MHTFKYNLNFSYIFSQLPALDECLDPIRGSCNFDQREKFEGYENMGRFICKDPVGKSY